MSRGGGGEVVAVEAQTRGVAALVGGHDRPGQRAHVASADHGVFEVRVDDSLLGLRLVHAGRDLAGHGDRVADPDRVPGHSSVAGDRVAELLAVDLDHDLVARDDVRRDLQPGPFAPARTTGVVDLERHVTRVDDVLRGTDDLPAADDLEHRRLADVILEALDRDEVPIREDDDVVRERGRRRGRDAGRDQRRADQAGGDEARDDGLASATCLPLRWRVRGHPSGDPGPTGDLHVVLLCSSVPPTPVRGSRWMRSPSPLLDDCHSRVVGERGPPKPGVRTATGRSVRARCDGRLCGAAATGPADRSGGCRGRSASGTARRPRPEPGSAGPRTHPPGRPRRNRS